MRYIPPIITATYPANFVIQSEKGALVRESDQIELTAGASYQSEE